MNGPAKVCLGGVMHLEGCNSVLYDVVMQIRQSEIGQVFNNAAPTGCSL